MPIALADLYLQTRHGRKVIVVALGFLGDSIHLIPALWEIKRNYPNAELHVATTPLGAEVLRLVPCVDRLWRVERNPRQFNWRHNSQILRAVRREHFDLAISVSGANRPVIWTGLNGARQRVAPAGARNHFWYPLLIPHWVPRQPPGMPVAEQHLNLLAACGLALSAPRWEFRLPEGARQKAESLVPLGALHLSISASAALKEWPLENWGGLTRQLLARDPQARVVATGSLQPRELERLQALRQLVASERLITLSGLGIAELAAVLQRCRLHVGADSGVLHLAAAVGLPTVSLFRDYHDASAWTPKGPKHHVFRAPCVCVNQREQPCAVQNLAACLAKLEVEKVVAAIQENLLIAGTTSTSHNRLA